MGRARWYWRGRGCVHGADDLRKRKAHDLQRLGVLRVAYLGKGVRRFSLRLRFVVYLH